MTSFECKGKMIGSECVHYSALSMKRSVGICHMKYLLRVCFMGHQPPLRSGPNKYCADPALGSKPSEITLISDLQTLVKILEGCVTSARRFDQTQ